VSFQPSGLDTRAYRGEWVITSMLVDRAERFADEVAVESKTGALSYSQLVERAAAVAHYLRDLGTQPGDRVATMLTSDLDYLAAWHGILWCGAVDVPVNVEYKGMFLEFLLNDAQVEVLVIDARWLPRLAEIDVPALRHVIVAGRGEFDGASPRLVVHSLADALSGPGVARTQRGELDPTYVVYTSGTTGSPKGVIHNNRSSVHYLMPFLECLGIGDDDVCYSMFPLYHQTGRSACTSTALWAGNRLVLRDRFSATEFWRDLVETGSTWTGYHGAALLFLWHQEPSDLDRAHRLRLAVGASAPREIFDAWEQRFGVRLYEVFGMTELGVGTGLTSGERKLGTLGRACRQIELQIHDEAGDELPAFEVGEAVWRPRYPDAIFQGYWNNADATIEAWRDLWFHSGDAGYLDDEGFFVLSDRIKDSIRRRGENISSRFVEEAVRRVLDVAECAAYPVPLDVGGNEQEVMIALVWPREEPLDVTAAFRQLCDALPRHAVPRYLRIVDQLPYTATQRARKFILRDEGVTTDSHDRVALGIEPVRG
jgi:carnitine-CoA ligase